MVFERIIISGFGCLRARAEFAPDKVNLLITNNEAGKSTLVSALLAAFYGIEDDQRKISSTNRTLAHRVHVTPWSNPEQFGVSLDFAEGKNQWRIIRDFHENKVALVDRETGKDHSHTYHIGKGRYNIGESLIGLKSEDFLRSFYLRQNEIHEIQFAGGLTPHVQRVATAREGGSTSENAIERLNESLKHYPFPNSKLGVRIEEAIKRYQRELDDVWSEIEKLKRTRSEIEPQCLKRNEIELQFDKLKAERKLLDQMGDIAEIGELQAALDAQERLLNERERLSTELNDLRMFEDFPTDREDSLNRLTLRIEESEINTQTLRKKVEELEQESNAMSLQLDDYGNLSDTSDSDLRQLDMTISKYEDRLERLQKICQERNTLEERVTTDKVTRENYRRLSRIFSETDEYSIEFLKEYESKNHREEMASREARAKLALQEKEHEQLKESRSRISTNSYLLFTIAGLLLVAGALILSPLLSVPILLLGPLLIIAGGGGGAYGMYLRLVRSSRIDAKLKETDRELAEAVKASNDSCQKLNQLSQKLTSVAEDADLHNTELLLQEFKDYISVKTAIEPLLAVDKSCDSANGELDWAYEQLCSFFVKAGLDKPEPEAATEPAHKLFERFQTARSIIESRNAVAERKQEKTGDLKQLEDNLERDRRAILEILEKGGIETEMQLSEAVKTFHERAAQCRRFKIIASELLPRLERDIVSYNDITSKRKRLAQLQDRVRESESGVSPEKSASQYRDEADEMDEQLEQLSDERQAISINIGATFENYQAKIPELLDQEEKLQHAIRQAETFHSEVEQTMDIMSEISKNVYRSWASALNEETAPILTALNPRYRGLNFMDDLHFVLTDNQTNRTLASEDIENFLSTGARDEILLSARLGIASYLSRGATGSLPVVLDEPLVSADDEKFLSGMRFLMSQLSTQNQVILLSCHSERHKWLTQKLGDEYRERIQEIVLEETSEVIPPQDHGKPAEGIRITF